MPAQEGLLAPFEAHTRVIPRHEAGKQVEFDRKARPDEAEGGIISDLPGRNPCRTLARDVAREFLGNLAR